MNPNLSLAVGVAKAGSLTLLNGAINGARAFHEWAGKMRYESHLLIDDPDPVTVEVLRQAFDAIFEKKERVHRLLLYFSGHGMIRDAEERLWFLSEWDARLEVVHVEFLRRRLMRYYNIEQIAIFADACSVLPSEIAQLDLSLDGVVPKRPLMPVVDTQIDRFDASQDGDAALMLPFEDPENDRGLFSGVLLEALWGAKADAFSTLKQNKVTSGSLGSYLKAQVPRVAKLYKRELKPRISPTFEEKDDIYFEASPTFAPPTLPIWPSPDAVLGMMGPSTSTKIDIERFDVEREFTFRQDDSSSPTEAQNPGQMLIDKIDRQTIAAVDYHDIGVKVQGAEVKSLWSLSTSRELWRSTDQRDAWFLPSLGHRLAAEPVLIEFEDGLFAALTALPAFTTQVVRDTRGVSALVYLSTVNPNPFNRMVETALAAMENGTLQIDALVDLATGLRQDKHRDPLLGVISAYLYDSIGDLANIRRMAYYYIQNGQPVPYDIALLAQAPSDIRDGRLWINLPDVPEQKPRTELERSFPWTCENLKAVRGEVAGFWPWMRQGWTYLEDPMDVESGLIHPRLSELIHHLRPGRFVMLDSEGGHYLSELFGFRTSQHKIIRKL